MLKHILAALLLAASALPVLAADPVEGVDYTRVPTPTDVEVPGKIEVREFFWYGCPHCFRLNPFIEDWLKTRPADVNFIRTPAALNSAWEVQARAFYAARILGAGDQAHHDLFNAIHLQGRQLSTRDTLAAFYSDYGINPDAFETAYDSPQVASLVQQSVDMALTYKVDGVPTIVVNGRYRVGGESQDTINTVNYLVARERARLQAARKP